MRLSSLADYAVVMMAAAARHCGGVGIVKGARLNATQLAEETGLPLPTVQKLVSKMSAAGLLESTRGTGPPATISIADIVEAIEGPIALTACVDSTRHDCAVERSCRVRPHWQPLNDAVRGALAGVTLASLNQPTPFVSGEAEKRVAGQRFPTALEANG